MTARAIVAKATLGGVILVSGLVSGTKAQQAPDSDLVAAQAQIDAGQFAGAESAVRAYLKEKPESADAHYLLAFALFKQNDPRRSLEEYQTASRYRPPSALDLIAVGSDYLLMEDYLDADRALTGALKLDPNGALTYYLLGRVKYNQQQFPEAVELFKQSIGLDPTYAKAAENLGLAYEQLGRAEDAIASYRTAIADDTNPPRNEGPFLKLGTLLTENGRPVEALPYLNEAVRITPDDTNAHRELGKAYVRSNQLDKAKLELEKAVELDPLNAPGHFLLSQVYSRRGDAVRAQHESDQYMALAGQSSAPSDELREARSLMRTGDWSGSAQRIRKYLDSHKGSADGHYLLGYSLFKLRNAKESLAEYTEGAKYRKPSAYDLEVVGSDYVLLHDYADADKWFSRAVAWDPGNFQARYYLGRTKYNENRFEEAADAFMGCLKLDPRNVRAEDNLGLAYEGLNRNDDAIAAYRTAISWEPADRTKDSGPYIDLGTLLISVGRWAEAVPVLLEGVKSDGTEMRAHRELGKAYLNLGQLELAQAELQKAVELAPKLPSPHYLLAQVYRKRGLSDKAEAEFDRYRTLAADHSTDESAQDR